MDMYKLQDMALIALFFFLLPAFSSAEISSKIGINYGRVGSNLPPPAKSIEILRDMNVGRVKLYDANPEILQLLRGSDIQVSIMVTNDLIPGIAASQVAADQWVEQNVLAHYPATLIRFILVGNEILSYNATAAMPLWTNLVPAMQRIKNSLRTQNIRNIKIGTPLAMDIMGPTFPPSSGVFRDALFDVLLPLLNFLNKTKSFFFVDVYPYFPWAANPSAISLDYALFRGQNSSSYKDPVSGLVYTNLLDQMLDSVVFAMEKLGFSNIKLAISETGWPNGGDVNELGADISYAAAYNRNLVRKMRAKPALGTPAKPGRVIPTFIFSLFDENQKAGVGTERHWGLYDPSGRPHYALDLSGKLSDAEYDALSKPEENVGPVVQKKNDTWCVVAKGAKDADIDRALSYACGQVKGLCDLLMPGKECYEPVSLINHANYAFSTYWARSQNANGTQNGNGTQNANGTCSFNGTAVQTNVDPSHGSCKFPSVLL